MDPWINQSINQPINGSMNQSIIRSTHFEKLRCKDPHGKQWRSRKSNWAGRHRKPQCPVYCRKRCRVRWRARAVLWQRLPWPLHPSDSAWRSSTLLPAFWCAPDVVSFVLHCWMKWKTQKVTYKAKSLSWNSLWVEIGAFPWWVGGDKFSLRFFYVHARFAHAACHCFNSGALLCTEPRKFGFMRTKSQRKFCSEGGKQFFL